MEQKLSMEIDQMPPCGPHHRRAHSDTAFRLDDLLLFDPSDLDLLPSPIPPRDHSIDDSSSNGLQPLPPVSSHRRSLSVDADFCDGVFDAPSAGEKRVSHKHSISMDGSVMTSFELESAMGIDGVKKAIGADRLAELALIDPKRAKRILANRQSAARSKERKIRYTGELERKVLTLQAEATNLSAQVTVLQRDSSGLTTENKELKLRLQAMEQEAKLRDALNEALREELQRLKIAAAQVSDINENPFDRGLAPQFPPEQTSSYQVGGHQNQLQQNHQQQVHMPQPSMNNQTTNGRPQPHFMDFNQRI